MDILARLADHAAGILALVHAARGAESVAVDGGELAGIERVLASAPAARREAALALLTALERLLSE